MKSGDGRFADQAGCSRPWNLVTAGCSLAKGFSRGGFSKLVASFSVLFNESKFYHWKYKPIEKFHDEDL